MADTDYINNIMQADLINALRLCRKPIQNKQLNFNIDYIDKLLKYLNTEQTKLINQDLINTIIEILSCTIELIEPADTNVIAELYSYMSCLMCYEPIHLN